jgi:N-acetylneuraminate synthase
MGKTIKIGNKLVGKNQPCFIIAEIGINHNGDVEIAKKLIDIAAFAGCDAVKFQKRTVEVVYSQEELERPRQNPFGETNGDLKRGLEFGYEEYAEIDEYCKQKGIMWFASCWDEASVDFINQFDVPCFKIASASLTDLNLLKHTRNTGKPVILATGMSSKEEVDQAISCLDQDNLVLLQCTSTYPSENTELNLRVIETFEKQYDLPVGYSGHEKGLMPSVIAVCLGACIVERHITLDRAMWGSDHAASIEPQGLIRLIRDNQNVPIILGDGDKKVYNSEKPIIDKLRRVKVNQC